uniref:Uncharacterized protein n=1 Tax=Steinernema glaseri TaxID=37863 RepID=A0A1I7ZRZ8_9BILA
MNTFFGLLLLATAAVVFASPINRTELSYGQKLLRDYTGGWFDTLEEKSEIFSPSLARVELDEHSPS